MKLWKDEASGIYRVRFTAPDGVREKHSCKTKIKGQAEEKARELWDAAVLRSQGKEPVVTLGKLKSLWLAGNSTTASIGHWNNVNTWPAYGLEGVMVNRCTTELVEIARDAHAKGKAPATVNLWVRTLNLLGRYAIKRGMIPALPWTIGGQKVQKKPRKTLPASKVREWIAAAESTAFKSHRLQIGTALRLMIGLGLRESEALGAQWEWLDWERKTYTVGKAKGFEARVIPVPDWLLAYLLPAKKDLGLILGEKRPGGFTRKAIAGANATMETPGISAHRLRGTFATLHSEAGTPVQVIQSMLGHKSATTTMLYLESHTEKATEQQGKVAAMMGF